MFNGRIWWLSHRRKYGLIRATNTGENIPFRIKDYQGKKQKFIDLVEGDEVIYDVNALSEEYKAINIKKYISQN